MPDKINGIHLIGYTSTRVEPVRRYTKSEHSEKLKQIEMGESDRAEIRAYFARYPNKEHLSFQEWLDHYIKGTSLKKPDDEVGYELDIKSFKK